MPQILINREPLKHLTFDVELLGDCDVIVQELCLRLGDGWTSICDRATPARQIQREDMHLAEDDAGDVDDVTATCGAGDDVTATPDKDNVIKEYKQNSYKGNRDDIPTVIVRIELCHQTANNER